MKRTLVFAALGLSLYATGPAMADSMLGDPSALATRHQWAVESGCSEPYLSSLDETCELASQDQSNSVAQLPQGQEKNRSAASASRRSMAPICAFTRRSRTS